MSALLSGPGRRVATVSYRQPSRGDVLRAAAEHRRHHHVPDLTGRCLVDGQAHPCYDHTAASLMLTSVPESTVTPPGGVSTAVALVVSVVLAVAGLAAVWLLWV